jgi:hypothetical protein
MFGHCVFSAAGFGVFHVRCCFLFCEVMHWMGPGHMALAGATAFEPLVAKLHAI